MSVPILVAVTGAREAPLVAELERCPGEVRVLRRCADLAELLSVALSGLAGAAVVSADLDQLDRDAVARLAHAGLAVVGLTDSGSAVAVDPDGERRLRAIGVDRVLDGGAPGSRIAQAVVDAVADRRARAAAPRGDRAGTADPGTPESVGARPPGPVALGTADPADALAAVPAVGVGVGNGTRTGSRAGGTEQGRAREEDGRARQAPGYLLAVWGPTGAPGRTTVAVSVAGELASRGVETLLVDADTYGPCIAQTVGITDESSGIAAAVRAAATGALDTDLLARLSLPAIPALRVLTGLPQPSRWPELRPTALEAVWTCARSIARWTVVDCGFGLETDEELSYDTAAPRRNGATLSALAAADLVIVVGTGDPVGLRRLVRGIADLAEAAVPSDRCRVMVTKVRESSVGPRADRRIAHSLSRFAGMTVSWMIPDTRAVYDKALLGGRLLVESAPRSPARLAFADVVSDLEEAVLKRELSRRL